MKTIETKDLAALAEAYTPGDAEVDARVARALRPPPPKRSSRAWLVVLPLAAAAALVWWARAAVEGPLEPNGDWAEVRPGLMARGDGRGQVSTAGVMSWDHGTLEVSLEPGSGPLQVRTPEALVEVVGTVFRVERDDYGTVVEVEHGTVHVTCTGGSLVPVSANDAAVCPLDAGAALAIGNRAPLRPVVRLRAAESGLARSPAPVVGQSLRALGVRAALDASDVPEAVRLARGLDPELPAGREALTAIVMAAPGCDIARAALESLATLDAGAAVALARCSPAPAQARAILQAVRPRVSPDDQRVLDAWLATYPE